MLYLYEKERREGGRGRKGVVSSSIVKSVSKEEKRQSNKSKRCLAKIQGEEYLRLALYVSHMYVVGVSSSIC